MRCHLLFCVRAHSLRAFCKAAALFAYCYQPAQPDDQGRAERNLASTCCPVSARELLLRKQPVSGCSQEYGIHSPLTSFPKHAVSSSLLYLCLHHPDPHSVRAGASALPCSAVYACISRTYSPFSALWLSQGASALPCSATYDCRTVSAFQHLALVEWYVTQRGPAMLQQTHKRNWPLPVTSPAVKFRHCV